MSCQGLTRYFRYLFDLSDWYLMAPVYAGACKQRGESDTSTAQICIQFRPNHAPSRTPLFYIYATPIVKTEYHSRSQFAVMFPSSEYHCCGPQLYPAPTMKLQWMMLPFGPTPNTVTAPVGTSVTTAFGALWK